MTDEDKDKAEWGQRVEYYREMQGELDDILVECDFCEYLGRLADWARAHRFAETPEAVGLIAGGFTEAILSMIAAKQEE